MTIIKYIYKSIFGKNDETVWRQFSTENNGTYVVGKYDNLDSVEINYSNHKIIFDQYIHYQVTGGSSFEIEYTRVRIEFKSNDNLQLRITEQGFIDNIGKLFGGQDIQIGDKAFDKRFMIKGTDEFKVQTLFSNEIVKNLILAQTDIHLQILDKEGIFNEAIQDGNAMLYYISKTIVKEIEQLNSLLKLYTTLVDQLTKLGSVKRLKASG